MRYQPVGDHILVKEVIADDVIVSESFPTKPMRAQVIDVSAQLVNDYFVDDIIWFLPINARSFEPNGEKMYVVDVADILILETDNG